MTDHLILGSLLRIEKLLQQILEQAQIAANPMNTVVALDNFRPRCPGCGNLKGKRHAQGCPHVVRKPARLKP